MKKYEISFDNEKKVWNVLKYGYIYNNLEFNTEAEAIEYINNLEDKVKP